MTPAAKAYGLLNQAESSADQAQVLRSQAISWLETCSGVALDALALQERVLMGVCWVRAACPQRGLPYLDVDFLEVPPETCGLAGSALLSLGALAPALVALRRAAKSPACQPAWHVNLGRALLMLGQTDEALVALQRGQAAMPDNMLAALSVAEAMLTMGRTDEALAQIPENAEDEILTLARVHLLGAASRHGDAAHLLQQSRSKHPDSLSLLLLSAELADVRGRSGESVAMLRKALHKEPDNIALWTRLALTGRKGMFGPHAREAANKAIALASDKDAPLRALAQNAHAHVLAEEGHVAEAEAAYRQALSLVPNFLPALSGLGHLLMQNGEVDDAVQCFQQVRAVAPLQGWSQLIHAREVPDDPQVLENMARAARQPGLEGPVRSGLLYTVAAAWDKKKEYDRAMTTAREANEACKKLLTYDPTEHRERVGREMARFSRAFMDSRVGWGNPSRLPVFVLGMPRSGTTLTEQILASHSQVFGAGELGLAGECIGKLESWERHVGSGLQYPACVADLGRERSAKLASHWLGELQAFDPLVRHVIDKLPHNFEHVGLIKLMFPNAIIFHCRREARDIAVSNYITDYAAKFGGMGFAYDLGWIGEQLVDHDRLMAHWHAVFPGQIFEVVYEDLVEDTEAWARRMIDFMGLQWEPGVLEFQDLERPVKTASVWQVRQPVYTTSKARWKRYEAHLGLLESVLMVVPPLPEPEPLPDLEPDLFAVGMDHLKALHLPEAQASFAQLLAQYPQHAAGHQFLGAALLQMGQPQAAVRAMRHSIQLLPLHPTWWENLARAEMAAGNKEGAQKSWVRGQRLRQKMAVATATMQGGGHAAAI